MLFSTVDVFQGVIDIPTEEGMAMLRGLEVAANLGYNSFLVEFDSKTVISGISSDEYDDATFGHILRATKVLMHELVIGSYLPVRRSGNKVAHNLARLSHKFVESFVWVEDYPPEIGSFVVNESVSLD